MPDLDVALPVGGRLVVAANLLLGRAETPASEAATAELVDMLDGWDGLGVFVIAGGLVDASDERNTRQAAMSAHPRLANAINAFASGEGRRVIVLPDDADALDVTVQTGAGERRVRIQPTLDNASAVLAEGCVGVVGGG